MDTQSLDHNFHSADVSNLHTDLHTHQDLLNDPAIGVHHDPFAPSSIGVYEPNHVHRGFDSQHLADYQPHHANSLLDHQYSHINHNSHLEHSFENQHLADYQPHHANSLLDHQYSQVDHSSHLEHSFENQHLADYQPHNANGLLDHQYSHIDHTSHLNHPSQRSGSASFTPSSPAEVVKNKEVIIKDEFGHDKSGTVTDKHSDGTYKVETSKEVYDNVSYHDVQKYGPK
jgi:hypothetical protein